MAGIYIHIPFCRKACSYCNFHFSTSLQQTNEVLNAIVSELQQRRAYLGNEPIETIYFGGGTPSLLPTALLDTVLQTIHKNYTLANNPEITLEANPDDLTPEKLRELQSMGINRLSIGVQSFHDDDLVFMNRTHTGTQAIEAVHTAQDMGLNNLSIDLIFGFPSLTAVKWTDNIQQALQLQVPHISCYSMTVEPRTALHHWVKTQQTPPLNPEQAAQHYEELMITLEQQGFEHYEISNFAKPLHRAIHNSNYWNGKKYLGVGPAAHSFDGTTRQWNISHNAAYVQGLTKGEWKGEREELTRENQLNETIMIGLRRMEGLHMHTLLLLLTPEEMAEFETSCQLFLQQKELVVENGFLKLTRKGKLLADHISSSLFVG